MIHKKETKTEIHMALTSMNSLSYSVISYGLFYGIKQAAFFYKLFEYLISNEIIRILPSLFFGYFISRAMLNTSINISSKKEWVTISIAVFDFLVLCVITDILKQQNWVDVINLLTFCAFVTYLGYWLNYVFVKKVKESKSKAKAKQELADIKQEEAITKQSLALISSNLNSKSKELAALNSSIANTKHHLEELEADLDDRTCPHCKKLYPSKKSRDAHKGSCPDNPNKPTKKQE
ncbi:hypothetical protein [Tenacibaculum sp. 190524A02b]|uniref:hypothetical protein n=1 Tax=Tenacibaculum vairaonense TaxID=3137860 RepID=UPI0031FAF344